MNPLQIITSLLTGSVIGIIYGLSFRYIGKKVLSYSTKRSMWLVTLWTVARLLSIAFILLFLLHTTMLHSMLVVIALLSAFWLIILV